MNPADCINLCHIILWGWKNWLITYRIATWCKTLIITFLQASYGESLYKIVLLGKGLSISRR